MMGIGCWVHCWGDASEQQKDLLTKALVRHGIESAPLNQDRPGGPGVCIFDEITGQLRDFLQFVSCAGRERIIAIARLGALRNGEGGWDLLQAGASDVLVWSDLDHVVRQVKARLERWISLEQLLAGPCVAGVVVAESPVWLATLRRIAEIARFSNASTLILGETGTGKEVVARLIHQLDSRPNKREFVVLDCSTIVSELSGSEFFGHERGAFTGAVAERLGAFALANSGTLFLDEVGELPLPLQAQLLRVIQEHSYKRVGGSTWHRTAFRLVCATNRNLLEMVNRGEFRADLFHRIASFICKLPPLRERLEDIIPLAEHFFRQAHPNHKVPELDPAIREYLLRREYPGNVRELQQVVSRLMCRCAGDGTITIGYVPSDERPACQSNQMVWLDSKFRQPIQRAVVLGAGLKDIGRAAEEIAIQYATDVEDGSLQRAARRLGVTDRALQLRRAHRRES
jgi:transcriptional regulator with GAF, ATPase, and Fis domain